jgi:hypothetical protein
LNPHLLTSIAISPERRVAVVKGLYFASGIIFGVLLTCAACMNGPAYSSGPYGPGPYGGPPPEGPGYYGGPPPTDHPEISQALNDLQHARYVLAVKAANDYHGHKANAIGYIDNAVNELQICQSMP